MQSHQWWRTNIGTCSHSHAIFVFLEPPCQNAADDKWLCHCIQNLLQEQGNQHSLCEERVINLLWWCLHGKFKSCKERVFKMPNKTKKFGQFFDKRPCVVSQMKCRILLDIINIIALKCHDLGMSISGCHLHMNECRIFEPLLSIVHQLLEKSLIFQGFKTPEIKVVAHLQLKAITTFRCQRTKQANMLLMILIFVGKWFQWLGCLLECNGICWWWHFKCLQINNLTACQVEMPFLDCLILWTHCWVGSAVTICVALDGEHFATLACTTGEGHDQESLHISSLNWHLFLFSPMQKKSQLEWHLTLVQFFSVILNGLLIESNCRVTWVAHNWKRCCQRHFLQGQMQQALTLANPLACNAVVQICWIDGWWKSRIWQQWHWQHSQIDLNCIVILWNQCCCKRGNCPKPTTWHKSVRKWHQWLLWCEVNWFSSWHGMTLPSVQLWCERSHTMWITGHTTGTSSSLVSGKHGQLVSGSIKSWMESVLQVIEIVARGLGWQNVCSVGLLECSIAFSAGGCQLLCSAGTFWDSDQTKMVKRCHGPMQIKQQKWPSSPFQEELPHAKQLAVEQTHCK